MAKSKVKADPVFEVTTLLKRLTILQMFQLGVAQGVIAKKLKVDVHFVNDFLKGIRDPNAQK